MIHIRGQSCNNSVNVNGNYKGVLNRNKNVNPAVFLSCQCDSYNLVLCDAEEFSVKSVSLIGKLHKKI